MSHPSRAAYRRLSVLGWDSTSRASAAGSRHRRRRTMRSTRPRATPLRRRRSTRRDDGARRLRRAPCLRRRIPSRRARRSAPRALDRSSTSRHPLASARRARWPTPCLRTRFDPPIASPRGIATASRPPRSRAPARCAPPCRTGGDEPPGRGEATIAEEALSLARGRHARHAGAPRRAARRRVRRGSERTRSHVDVARARLWRNGSNVAVQPFALAVAAAYSRE